MLVRLNCFRGDNGPGDVIDIDEAEAAGLLVHGAAHPVQAPPAPQKLPADLREAARTTKAAAKEAP